MRTIFGVTACFMGVLAAVQPSTAQGPRESVKMCLSDDPQRSVTGCTRLLSKFKINREARAKVYYNRGSSYIALKRYLRAIADFNQAIELNPRFAFAYSNRGAAYYEMKDYERALADYDRAIRLNPRDAKAYWNRGLLYEKIYKKRRRAIADYRAAYRLQPSNKKYAAKLRALGAQP